MANDNDDSSGTLARQRQLVLLAPDGAELPETFNPITPSCETHDSLLASMQRMRGEVYLADGAIEPWQLTPDHRHVAEGDERAWHILITDGEGDVLGCARYLPLECPVRFRDMGVARSALAACSEWGPKLQAVVEQDAASAFENGRAYVEVGGWALRPEIRGTTEAMRLVLSTYALARMLGGSVGIATATFRNYSAEILQRLGGRLLSHGPDTFPKYYDPNYRCDMALLRFDSGEPNPRFQSRIDNLTSYLSGVPIICNENHLPVSQPHLQVA